MKSAETNESAIVEKPRDTNKDDKMEKCEVDAEWDDPTTLELEELLSSSLSTAFTNAVKKVVGCGYSKETAEWAILSSSNFNGHKNAESNIVEGALALLKMNEHMKMPKKSVFEGLQSLVEYTLLEMIHVVWELRPDLMVTEVMWCLLVSDLQLATACGLRRGPESAGGSPGQPSGTGQSNCGKSDSLMTGNSSKIYHSDISSVRPAQYQRPNPGGLGKEATLSLQELKDRFSGIADMDKKPKALALHLKKDLLRQKAIHFEKNYRGRFTKGSFKAKVAAWGSMVLDQSLKSQSGVAMMENYSRLSISEGKEKNPGNPQLADKVPLSAFPAGNTDTHMRDEKVNFTEPPTSKEPTSYCAQSTFDGILQEYVGKDEKNQFFMMIAPLKAELEKELQGWYDWANEKVMQATRKLGKEQAELKTLRREKEDIEKSKKEKQILEESTAKHQAELDHAMVKAIGQNELANCTVKRLEAANNVLRKEMEDARMEARGSAVNLDEAVEKEQEMMKKLQAWKLENTLMTEKLTIARQEHTELESQIGKVKNRQNQFKLLLRQEEKENLKAQRLIDFLRGEREKVEAQTKAEAESINQTAQMKKQKLEESIKNLRTIISELKQESDKKKIADLNVGYGPNDGKRLAVCEEIFGTGGVKEERECVVCMNDEISVLFLPCAHLVLCGPCNARHEKQGMKDCPSCRGTIEKRVSLNFRE